MVPNAVWARRDVVDAFDRSVMDLPSFLVPFEVPEHLDEDAIACCLNMLERNLPPSDILLMAYSPAEELLPDTQAQDNAMLDLLIQRYMGNPNINQDELMKLDWSRKLGDGIAKQVILPKAESEGILQEAIRQQVIELQSIIAGQEVPVSPRDNDMAHLNVMAQKLFPLIANAPEGSLPPEMLKPFTQALQHFMDHVNQAKAKGQNVSQFEAMAKEAVKHLTASEAQAMPPDMMPAAGAGMPPAGGGMRRPSVAATKEVGRLTEEQAPSQGSTVYDIAHPPKPVTAG